MIKLTIKAALVGMLLVSNNAFACDDFDRHVETALEDLRSCNRSNPGNTLFGFEVETGTRSQLFYGAKPECESQAKDVQQIYASYEWICGTVNE